MPGEGFSRWGRVPCLRLRFCLPLLLGTFSMQPTYVRAEIPPPPRPLLTEDELLAQEAQAQATAAEQEENSKVSSEAPNSTTGDVAEGPDVSELPNASTENAEDAKTEDSPRLFPEIAATTSPSSDLVQELGSPVEAPGASPDAEQVPGTLDGNLGPDSPPLVTEGTSTPQSNQPAGFVAASFNGVRPGDSTLQDVQRAWGEPLETLPGEFGESLVFEITPFQSVTAEVAEGKVTSIVVRLQKPLPASTIAQELKLDEFTPVVIKNENQEELGISYPERGVFFVFSPDEADPRVSQIMLDPIAAQPFVLRAEQVTSRSLTQRLADVHYALTLDPNQAQAWWLKAALLLEAESSEEAEACAAKAVKLEPRQPEYRLTWAKALKAVGRFSRGIQEAQIALKEDEIEPVASAEAVHLLGQLMAHGPERDYRQAVDYHMQAIQLADPLGLSRDAAVRRRAKKILLDAHLSIAEGVALGDWRNKSEVVPQWLARASAFADDLVDTEQSSLEVRLRVHARTVAVCASLQGAWDPVDSVRDATELGEQILDSTEDPLERRAVALRLSNIFSNALLVEFQRKQPASALQYGAQALGHLRPYLLQEPTPQWRFTAGLLYFRLGAVHAVLQQDHAQATNMYDQAMPLLESMATVRAIADEGELGEAWVSMGVTYWEVGRRELAIQLTRRGLDLMQSAVSHGRLPENALLVPYENLASMYRSQGDTASAREFTELARGQAETTIR